MALWVFSSDAFNYYPSKSPFADRGAPDLQQETIGQQRTLTNTGLLSNVTYTHGINNMKAGVSYAQTFLTEHPHEGYTAVSGAPPQCRATTRKGSACQRTPLPHNGYCPSHQHLADTEDRELAAA